MDALDETRSPRRGRARWIGAALALAGAVVVGILATEHAPHAQSTPPAAAAAPQAVPVTIAAAKPEDVPVVLRGLGIAQAFNAVTVRARVDGTLMSVKVTEGQEVKKGDLVAVIDPRPYQASLDAAMAKKAQDEAQLTNAQRDLARYTSLARQDFASRQQVDTQQASVAQFTATLKGDDAAIATAQLNLSFCYILSPIDGRVGLRMMDPGNLVHATDSGGIISIAQLHPISVVFTLPQQNLPKIIAAMASRRLPVDAYAENDTTELARGELLTPDNSIDTSTGTIKLKANFANAENTLWPGQFVHAHLLLETRHDVLTVPSDAVQHGPSGLYAYVVKPDSTVTRQAIEVDQDTGKVAVVTKGLAAGDKVVVAGQARLQNGTRVADASQFRPAAAPPPKAGG
jgi:multidrug efflux system membrane fusion protein